MFKKIVDFFRYNSDGYDNYGYDRQGFDKAGYSKDDYDRSGYHRNGFNKLGYDRQGFNKFGYDKDGFGREGFDQNGYDREGFNKLGYNKEGYDRDGFDKNGHDKKGFNRIGNHRETGNSYDPRGYNKDGFDREGFDQNGYDREGYNKLGYNKEGYDRQGFNILGFNIAGIHKDTGSEYNPAGLNSEGKTKKQVNEELFLNSILDQLDFYGSVDFDEVEDYLRDLMSTLNLELNYGTPIAYGNHVKLFNFKTLQIIEFKCDDSTTLGAKLMTKRIGSNIKLMNGQMAIVVSQSNPK
jgi:hypothetical protein